MLFYVELLWSSELIAKYLLNKLSNWLENWTSEPERLLNDEGWKIFQSLAFHKCSYRITINQSVTTLDERAYSLLATPLNQLFDR